MIALRKKGNSAVLDSMIGDLERLAAAVNSISALQKATSGLYKAINFISNTIDKINSNFVGRMFVSKYTFLGLFLSKAHTLKSMTKSLTSLLERIKVKAPIIVKELQNLKETGKQKQHFSGHIWAFQSTLLPTRHFVGKYVSLLKVLAQSAKSICGIFDKIKALPGIARIMRIWRPRYRLSKPVRSILWQPQKS